MSRSMKVDVRGYCSAVTHNPVEATNLSYSSVIRPFRVNRNAVAFDGEIIISGPNPPVAVGNAVSITIEWVDGEQA